MRCKLFALLLIVGLSGTAQATLIDRGGGMVYDDVLNITWLQDANQGAGSAFDDGVNTADGLMTWDSAVAWADGLLGAAWEPPVAMDGEGWFVAAKTEHYCRSRPQLPRPKHPIFHKSLLTNLAPIAAGSFPHILVLHDIKTSCPKCRSHNVAPTICNQSSGIVTAPSEAELTALAYLASRPDSFCALGCQASRRSDIS